MKLTVNYPLDDNGEETQETIQLSFNKLADALLWLIANPGWSSYVIIGTDIPE